MILTLAYYNDIVDCFEELSARDLMQLVACMYICGTMMLLVLGSFEKAEQRKKGES